MIVRDMNELTPIEEYNGIYFKRDDLFQPFDDIPLSGGKVRQAMKLIENNLDKIQKDYNNTVITGTSVNSPQGIIISRVAKEYGVKSIIVFGNTNMENLKKNNLTHNCMKYATRIDLEAGMAYNNVLNARVFQICDEDRQYYFFINFGINISYDKDAIIDTVANQCENLPDDLDYIFVPAGSAIMLTGIIKGVNKFHKKGKVVGIQISGYDRTDVIYSSLPVELLYGFDFIIDKTYPYSKHLKIEVAPGFTLDPVYEAKAYEYMIKHYNLEGKKALFWVVGDSNMVRDNYYGGDS